jgi:hypothetical protein
VVASNRVRTAAAASQVASTIAPRCASLGLVLRSDPRGINEDAVLSMLAIPVLGRIPFAAGLAARADAGEPPALRDAYGRAVARLVPTVVGPVADIAS